MIPCPRCDSAITNTTTRVLTEVLVERERQDAKHGGVENDDRNTSADWFRHIRANLQGYETATYYGSARANGHTARDYLLRIAALAVATVEALDRDEAEAAGDS